MRDSDRRHDAGQLTAAQQALLQKRLRNALAPASAPPAIERRPDRGQFPLSFAQERFWFLEHLDQGGAAYNRPAAFRLQGPLDVAVLEHALSEVVRRHEVLRAIFPSVDGQPQQVIRPPFAVQLPVVDLSTLPEDQRETQAAELARKETQRPFGLTDSVPWRASLLRLARDVHILLLPMHHIISDAWSTGVLRRELATLYAAFVQGLPSPLQELPIQYADFANWQRQALQGAALEEHLSYWKRQLANLPASLDLPSHRPRPSIQTDHGQNALLRLPSALTTALRALSQAHNVTLFMTLLAAFQTLLYRYTGQEDIVVGTPVAGRAPAETEGLIGCFINTLVLRSDLSGNPTFRSFLATVRASCLDAYTHGDLPFEQLLTTLNPPRDLSRAPLFQVLFNSHLLPTTAAVPASDLTLSEFSFDNRVAQFDLSVDISVSPDPAAAVRETAASPPSAQDSTDERELACVLNYNTDLFDEESMQRMLGHYRTLLEGIVSDPGERLAFLPLLTAAERQQMLVTWNSAEQDYPPQCLHQLFEAHAQRTPDAIALIFEKRQYTYRDLNVRANALAHDLIRHGVGPEVPVGIFIDHRPETVVALLAVHKAGGAYVPLNPDHPLKRLAFILRDTALRCVLTLPGTAHLLPAADIEHLDVDLDQPEPTGENATNPVSAVTAAHLAYIIYTSGSTGVPRGVLVPHRGVSNVVAWGIAANELAPNCRMTEIVSLSFDVAAFHLWMPLTSGAAVYLASQELVLSPPALADAMLENAVTHAGSTTSLMAALPVVDLPALRVVNVGGEACPTGLVQRWAPGRRFLNEYGPTEATIWATAAECSPDATKPHIGRPIPNTQAYILDRYLQPVPVGVTGDLYLAGIGLSRGYLNQADTTAERFIPNPFSAQPGARMYRSGDLARYLPDGNIDFIGRSDFQVKIRGFRVEPGEIEAVLRRHPAVHEAIVVARQGKSGDLRLVAYSVLHRQATATPADLQEHLRQVLPYYMVPSAVVLLEAVPLTSSGKVDRRALPAPSDSAAPASQTFVAPRTTTEANIAEIWKEVLALDQIGVHDNFFDLGGYSLLAMRAIALIEKRLGLRLGPRDFIFQTLAQLAASCDERIVQHPKNKASPRSIGRVIKRLMGDKS